MAETGYRLLRSERIYEGRVVSLRRDLVADDAGAACLREVVEHRGAVAVVALLDGDRVLMVNQYRHAVAEWLLEIPAGTLEQGEHPEWCAVRELEEETGYTARRVRLLFGLYVSPGYCNEVVHVFVADQLTAGQPRPETDEQIEVAAVPLADVPQMIAEGRIRDAKTVAALLAVLASR